MCYLNNLDKSLRDMNYVTKNLGIIHTNTIFTIFCQWNVFFCGLNATLQLPCVRSTLLIMCTVLVHQPFSKWQTWVSIQHQSQGNWNTDLIPSMKFKLIVQWNASITNITGSKQNVLSADFSLDESWLIHNIWAKDHVPYNQRFVIVVFIMALLPCANVQFTTLSWDATMVYNILGCYPATQTK